MGFSTDDMPFVGKLPVSLTGRDLSGGVETGCEWVAAGYCGEGMVNAWRSGIAVGQMILEELSPEDKGDWQDWLPEEFCITDERIERSTFLFPAGES